MAKVLESFLQWEGGHHYKSKRRAIWRVPGMKPALKRPASAVRSRLWPHLESIIYRIYSKPPATREAFDIFLVTLLFSARCWFSGSSGLKKAGVAHCLSLSITFKST